MRPLTSIELQRMKTLASRSIEVTLIEPTKTGLTKSILDATHPVRNYLKKNKVHDYAIQGQGPWFKKKMRATFYHADMKEDTITSMYRPSTKKGDPRIWFRGLKRYALPNDVLAITFFEDALHIFNLSQCPIDELLETQTSNPIADLISRINETTYSVSKELLSKILSISKQGFVPSSIKADTAIGRTLESQLGIEMNSSKSPDYKGIELKSFRSKRGNRKTLFAQVPNWKISKLKSSKEILETFGYDRNGAKRLNCTVSATTTNTQGLRLNVQSEKDLLHEYSAKNGIGDFATWELSNLQNRLVTKHKETFWIEADSKIEDGKEWFHYTRVEHTSAPIESHFITLLETGVVTLDHLIKMKDESAHERGPLFKIKPNSLDLLFPTSKIYELY